MFSTPSALRAWFVIVAVVVLAMPAGAQNPPPEPGRRDFVDKWLINGGNLGGAAGAVIGQLVIQRFLPGPLAGFVGSFIGNQVGQLIGEFIDNKVGKAYNYAAFNRPALGEGGSLSLQGAGRRENIFYLVDRWGISGGALATLFTHNLLNYLGRSIPGAGILAAPLFLLLADYVAGCIGDNLDGALDFSQLGRRLDQRADARRGAPPATALAVPPIAPPSFTPVQPGPQIGRREAYERLVSQLRSGRSAGLPEAYDRYRDGAR